MSRTATINRETKETTVSVTIDLDGTRLARLLTGAEGTLATTLAARVRLVREPAAEVLPAIVSALR